MFGMGRSPPPPRAEDRKQPAPAKKAAPVRISLSLSAEQRDKLELLGGEDWLREQIDRAPAPQVFGRAP